jgi:large subunit ribosomal protein L16
MFELTYPNEHVAQEALQRAAHKLPMKCRVVRREVSED